MVWFVCSAMTGTFSYYRNKMKNWKNKVLESDVRGRVNTVEFIEELIRTRTLLAIFFFMMFIFTIGYIIFYKLW